jgi:hypothetical protein
MKKNYFKLEEVKLPFDELALNDDELFVIKGGENQKVGDGSGCNCGCQIGSQPGSGSGCNCGCDKPVTSLGEGCNCNCVNDDIN